MSGKPAPEDALPETAAGALEEESPRPSERASDPLLVVGGLMALATLAFLVAPASVFEYPRALPSASPLDVIYGPSGQWLILIAFGALCALYALALSLAGPEARPAYRSALAVCVLLGILFTVAYPTGSRDLFKNISDSRTLWLYQDNPRSTPPVANPDDPMLGSLTLRAWQRDRAYYGFLTYVAYGPPALIGGSTPLGNMLAFKGYHALVLIGLAAFLAANVPSERRAQALVCVGWNPLLLYEGVANAHNDLLMAAAFGVGVVMIARRQLVTGGIAWLVSIGTKFVTALVAPVVYVWLLRNLRGKARLLLLSALPLGLAAALTYLAVYGVPGYGVFARGSAFRTPYSVVYYWLRPEHGHDYATDVARAFSIVAFAALTLVVLARIDASRRSLHAASFWLLAFSAAFMTHYVWPWYLVWFIPLGALLLPSVEARTAIVFTAAGLAIYGIFPWLGGHDFRLLFLRGDAGLNLLQTLVIFGAPFAYAVADIAVTAVVRWRAPAPVVLEAAAPTVPPSR